MRKNMIYGFFTALVAGLIIAFSLQNAGTVTVLFLAWKIEMSLVSLVVVAVLAGIVLTQLLRRWSAGRQNRERTAEIPNRRR